MGQSKGNKYHTITINTEILFFLSYTLWLFSLILFSTTEYANLIPRGILNYIRLLCIAMLILREFSNMNYSRKELCGMIIMFFLILIAFYNGHGILTDTIMFIFSARNIDIKKILMVSFVLQCVCMLFVIGSCAAGVIENVVYYRAGDSERWSIGYQYTTYSSHFYLNIVLLYIYLKKDTIHLFQWLVLLLGGGIIFCFTRSRNSFLLTILALIIVVYLKYFRRQVKNTFFNRIIFQYFIPLCAAISIGFAYVYSAGTAWQNKLNAMLNYRIGLGHSAIISNGINYWGQKIEWIGNTNMGLGTIYNYVDCSYLKIALDYGWVVLIVVCLFYYLLGRYAMETHDIYLCWIIVIIGIHSLFDPQLIDLYYNSFLLLFGKIHFEKHFGGKVMIRIKRKA